ncbi:MAG: reverse transcriptase-like protein [Candidatus Atribacteria bacterium]|nr:reverse transcriptase-like protein [Candidatus Atribacteria bacterium]MCK4308781.1 reverse transcriptase-like protein [Candidatus Atribacteria bacterium]
MSKILMKVDGSCYPNPGNMGIGIVIYKDGELVKKISEAIGYGTNNIAEYKALIRGLEEIKKLKPERADIYCDSQLVVKQLNKKYKVKDKGMIPLYHKVNEICSTIPGKIYFIWDRRDNNSMADSLAKKALLEEERSKRDSAAKDLKVERKGEYFLVSGSKSGKSYKVDINISQCECADFTQRAQKLKIECKHIIAVKKFLQKEKREEKLRNRQKMRVLVLSQMVKPQVWIETFDKLNQKAKLNIEFIIPEGEEKKSIKKYFQEAEVVIGGIFDQEDLDQAKKLKLIQIPFAGVDKLDFSLYKDRPDKYVCNIHANKSAVAEHAFALILALAKNVVSYDKDLRRGKWHGFSTKESTIQLQGRSLGIIGLGSIGWEIAKRAKSFGMKIFALKRRVNEKDLEKKEILEFLGEEKDLEKVIQESDFIVIALPLTPETTGLIGEKELKIMKGKYLINIARGAIIDEEALFKVLKEHYLAGAAIDTWYQYPNSEQKEILPSKYDFHKLDNVVMSPHTAGYTDRALEENIKSVFDNIVRIYYEEEPENRINPELEY